MGKVEKGVKGVEEEEREQWQTQCKQSRTYDFTKMQRAHRNEGAGVCGVAQEVVEGRTWRGFLELVR